MTAIDLRSDTVTRPTPEMRAAIAAPVGDDQFGEDPTEDHANARRIGERLARSPRVVLDRATVQTKLIVFGLADAATVVVRARERGVLVFAFGPGTVRAHPV